MKSVSLLCLLLSLWPVACKSPQKNMSKEAPFSVEAVYTAYSTAMGEGRGLIFRVRVKPLESGTPFSIDSFYVHGRPFIFSVSTLPGGLQLESNYLVNRPQPSANPDGTVTAEPTMLHDGIVEERLFYPSWVLITYNKSATRIPLIFTEEKPPSN